MGLSSIVKASVATAAAITLSTGAHAASFSWGVHDAPFESAATSVGTGFFADVYEFTVAAGFALVGSVNVSDTTAPDTSIAGGTYWLVDLGADATFGSADDVVLSPAAGWSFDSSTGATVNFDTSGPGAYAFVVGGTADGLDGGKYVLTSFIDVAAPAIPEPETYALMLAGLGVLGGMARLRRRAA